MANTTTANRAGRIRLAIGFLAASLGAQAAWADIAFPGADGFGAGAIGWKGGEIIVVDSLSDQGPGSLRQCAEITKVPRICVFTVSGTIDLHRSLWVGSNVYIAGQTAPGAGIQLRIVEGDSGTLILKNTRDVVIRFLKARPGPSANPSPVVDAVTVENGQNIYLGNLSMGFATDETFNVHVSNSVAVDITLADSILALSLDRSNHPKGRHSKGALICSDEGQNNQCGRISLLRNLFAHHRDRSPDIKATDIGPIEVINNVFYDPISQFGEFYDLIGNTEIAYLGNLALTGPSTNRWAPEAVQVFEWEDDFRVSLWAEDNVASTAEGCRRRRVKVLDKVAKAQQVAPDGWALAAVPMPSDAVLDSVLARAGDQIEGRRPPDSLDAQVIDDVLNCTGQVIDRVDQVGGWPEIGTTKLAGIVDSDGDGLPDEWEKTRAALDWKQPDDPWAIDPSSGMSHVETWLATLAGDKP
ncbi:MAG: hypothetical protein KUG62_07010 [Rhodobacteraceae bacterium]|nr:hypothetical protein [Paracoccaceae bacterium]